LLTRLKQQRFMAEPHSVCVVGSANVDLTFRMARLPSVGETVAAQSLETDFGGKGANQAVMAALAGASVSLVARVGADPFARQIIDNLLAHRVNVDHVATDAVRPTGVAAIFVDDAARNSIAVAPGANAGLAVEHVTVAADVIRAAKVLLCQLETPAEASLEAFRIARAAGVLTILNPAPARPLPDELLRLTDLCVPNETEAGLLTGEATESTEGAVKAAHALRSGGAQRVIVTLGARGCLIDDGSHTETVPAPTVAAVDPTGAGDAFLGVLAATLARKLSLREAVHRATAAAALSVTRPGAQASFPTMAELAAMFKRVSG
jgi:ribokinase